MKITIDIWSDFGCPFCYIGKKRIEQALNQFEGKDNVEFKFHSFQLDPNADANIKIDIKKLAEERGVTVERLKASMAHLVEKAKEVGLDLKYDTMINANTLDAHRLVHYASKDGKAAEMVESLLRACLSDSLNISDRNVLVSLAGEVGLNKTETMAMLQSEAYIDQVVADIELGQQLNITGVPFFVFNNKYAVSGAQSEHVFLKVLNTILEEDQETLKLQVLSQSKSEDNCAGGSCSI
ncbi:DsbA family oxidoreductase [Clostridium paridis]|uniref:DsbA family oxidoreductase n=1 Tax=Clostridium paridis TaxID=2803863 RepID=A0A937FAV7_9CLOT|nr:DsbA family oxidoreductase [Clostridium paridis]MBL4930549.1 DsbA family oxidoreductase [Clostridium paridis]